jgi:hypothetical protein
MELGSLEDLGRFARLIAAEVLPRELGRFGEADRAQVSALWPPSPECETVEDALAAALSSVLLDPPGDATSKLQCGMEEVEARAVAELFWRCAAAVCLMPKTSLVALARHHEDLQAHLDGAEGDELARHRVLIKAVLPRFAMSCTSRAEAEAAERRREEVAELKRQAAAERAADGADGANNGEELRPEDGAGVLL